MKVTLCKTKSGNGYKIVINELWLYASKEWLEKVVSENATSCQFQAIQDKE